MSKVLNHTSHKDIGKSRRNIIIVCEELDYNWDEDDLKVVADMCKYTYTVGEIAKHFVRDPDEVLFACVHLARQGKVERYYK